MRYSVPSAGSEQRKGTNSIGSKVEAGFQILPLEFTVLEAKGSLEKKNGEYGAATSFFGVLGEVKIVKGLRFGGVGKVDIFNVVHKK